MSKPKWLCYTLLFAAMFISAPLVAQDADSDADEAGALEEIIITGSRIRKDPLNEPAPIMNISDGDLVDTGLTNLGSILQQLPITG